MQVRAVVVVCFGWEKETFLSHFSLTSIHNWNEILYIQVEYKKLEKEKENPLRVILTQFEGRRLAAAACM